MRIFWCLLLILVISTVEAGVTGKISGKVFEKNSKEPLAGVNHYESGKLLDLFRRVRDMGTTILLIDHNLEAVFSVTDRVLVLDFGELIAEGTPEEILGNKLVSDVYLGE
jgi:ABC-type lipopolysaccharide export system ATPase subunit